MRENIYNKSGIMNRLTEMVTFKQNFKNFSFYPLKHNLKENPAMDTGRSQGHKGTSIQSPMLYPIRKTKVYFLCVASQIHKGTRHKETSYGYRA